MKLSSAILIVMLIFLGIGLFASNLLLKRQYNRVDKSDPYWNYRPVLQQPFKYLQIEGGNITHILFEQNPHCSVRVLDYWEGYKKNSTVKAFVRNDTLHLQFLYKYVNLPDKIWMQNHPVIRIAAPVLLSVDGFNTSFELNKMHQKSFSIHVSGRSMLEIESNIHSLDTLNITQADSSQMIVEMNPELKGLSTLTAKVMNACLKGSSILDAGHISINKTNLAVTDSAAVTVSGKALQSLKH